MLAAALPVWALMKREVDKKIWTDQQQLFSVHYLVSH